MKPFLTQTPKKMKKNAILLICCFLSVPLWAQYQERALVSASGYQGQAAGYFAEFSLGEPAIGTFSAAGYTALVGFHQPTVNSATDISYLNDCTSITVYPNPTNSWVNVQLHENDKIRLRKIILTDIRGLEVKHLNGKDLTSNPISIAMDDLNPGIYFMQVVFYDGSWKVIKVSLVN